MAEWLTRTKLLVGADALLKLNASNVLVVGLGGVGGVAAEMLCRAGIGSMTIADGDIFEESNLNRQILSRHSNLGRNKAVVCAELLYEINPELNLTVIDEFVRDEGTGAVLAGGFDYVVDAIDTLSPKVNLLAKCMERDLPVVSAMGAGGRMDPSRARIADISESFNCKLARAVRKRLHRRGINNGIQVVFSTEEALNSAVIDDTDENTGKRSSITGSISYMPNVFGCLCASVATRHLIARKASSAKTVCGKSAED